MTNAQKANAIIDARFGNTISAATRCSYYMFLLKEISSEDLDARYTKECC